MSEYIYIGEGRYDAKQIDAANKELLNSYPEVANIPGDKDAVKAGFIRADSDGNLRGWFPTRRGDNYLLAKDLMLLHPSFELWVVNEWRIYQFGLTQKMPQQEGGQPQ